MFDRIKAEHAQVMGLTDGMIDLPDTEGFQQPQDLDVFLPSAFVHACFEQASQSLEARRQCPLLQRRSLLERTRFLLQQGQIVQWVHHQVGFGITAAMMRNALWLADQIINVA